MLNCTALVEQCHSEILPAWCNAQEWHARRYSTSKGKKQRMMRQWSSLKPLGGEEVRIKSAADKLSVIAVTTCRSHLSCIRWFSGSTTAMRIFGNMCNLFLALQLRFQPDLLQISSNPSKSIKTWGKDQSSHTHFFGHWWADIHVSSHAQGH